MLNQCWVGLLRMPSEMQGVTGSSSFSTLRVVCFRSVHNRRRSLVSALQQSEPHWYQMLVSGLTTEQQASLQNIFKLADQKFAALGKPFAISVVFSSHYRCTLFFRIEENRKRRRLSVQCAASTDHVQLRWLRLLLVHTREAGHYSFD